MSAGDLVTNKSIAASQPYVSAGLKEQADRKAAEAKAAQDENLTRLQAYLTGQQAKENVQNKVQEQAGLNQENVKTLTSPELQSTLHQGGSVKVGDIAAGADPLAKLASQGPNEAGKFNKAAQGAYKGIHDQLDASQATLDNLNQGNSTGDKLALLNETKLALAGSGGRAFGAVMAHLSGDPTLAQDAQKAYNWLQNTPNIPTLQPAQRDALRESVYGRLPQLEQQHKQAAAQLAQLGPSLAPHADYNSILGAYASPADQKLQQIKQSQAQYSQQRQQMQTGGNGPVSTPSTASPNPTTLQRLTSFFGGNKPQAAPQASGKPQTVRQNGHTYTLNPQTGQYE